MPGDRASNPLIVQGDGTVLLDLGGSRAAEARERTAAFAELVKSPDHVHTYRIDPLSIWNARSAGLAPEAITGTLDELGKHPLDGEVARHLLDLASRHGRVELAREGPRLVVRADSAALAGRIAADERIGPKRIDVPWRGLERQGYIAGALCTEVRVPLGSGRRMSYATAPKRQRFRIAAENEAKLDLARDLLDRHRSNRALLFGEFVDQVEALARHLGAPAIIGKTAKPERERLSGAFRRGEERRLVLSRVGNFAVDLPDADLLVQLSGTFGSRQEEAQRLGRVLRPKGDGRIARFYTLVSRHTCEEDFARKRQRFLIEQGYGYRMEVLDR